tara:strand:+ start:160 stop:270 length:111 start_codon:yes stop_codon:yes gene_type:complete
MNPEGNLKEYGISGVFWVELLGYVRLERRLDRSLAL